MLWYEWFLIVGTITAWSVALMHYVYFKEHHLIEYFRPRYKIDVFKYMFKPVPQGYFTSRQPYFNVFAWLGAFQCGIGFLWLYICVPEMRLVANAYLWMVGVVATVCLVNYYFSWYGKIPMDILGVMTFGWCCWEDQILFGMLLALPFLLLSFLSVETFLQIKNMPIASFIVTVIMVPMVEEGFFRGVLAPSIAEFAGIFHGALATSILFAVFHAYVYHLDWFRIGVVFCFGFAASMVDFKFDSVLPSTIAHSIINFVAYLHYVF